MRIRNLAAVLATAAAVSTSAAACSSTPDAVYAPAAYGVPGYCYYVNSPAEAVALIAAGLCPSSWVPALAPLSWQETYWDYYDSPAYYDTYVPVSYRTVYVQRETAFGRTYRPQISARSKTATYRSSNGGTVKGSALPTGKSRFGSGSAGTSHGGGSLRSGSAPAAVPAVKPSAKPRSGSLRHTTTSSRHH